MAGRKSRERQASLGKPDPLFESQDQPGIIDETTLAVKDHAGIALDQQIGLTASYQDLKTVLQQLDETKKRLEEANLALKTEIVERERVEEALQTSLKELKTAEEEFRHSNDALVESRNRLEEERQRYQDLFEFAPDGYMVTDAFGVLLEVNQAAVSILGAEPKYLLGKPLIVYIQRGEHRAFSLLLNELRDTGGYKAREFTIHKRGGSGIPVALAVVASQEQNGNKRTLRWIFRDISERRRSEQAARESSARTAFLSEISQSLTEASLDENAILKTIATATANAIGDICIIRLASEDQKWLDPVALAHTRPEALALLKESYASFRHSSNVGVDGQVFTSGQAVLIPGMSREHARAIFSLQLNPYIDHFGIASALAVPLRIYGKIVGTLSLQRDEGGRPYTLDDQALVQTLADRAAQAIHNARLYQELQVVLQNEQSMRAQMVQTEKFAAMGRMLASITHEINNPLQTIKNCLYLGQQEVTAKSPIYEYISMAYAETNRLSNLVAQLREIYHPAAYQPKPVELAGLLSEVHNLMNTQLRSKKVQWKMDLLEFAGLKTEGVADQIKQVLINVCLNAIDAMQPSGGELMVDLIKSQNRRHVGIRFSDSGPGIAPEDIPRLFEPFNTTKEKGLGLGLAISYDIVQRHKGRIEVVSKPGEGTAFTIWLPVIEGERR